jgi:hypothetical protein
VLACRVAVQVLASKLRTKPEANDQAMNREEGRESLLRCQAVPAPLPLLDRLRCGFCGKPLSMNLGCATFSMLRRLLLRKLSELEMGEIYQLYALTEQAAEPCWHIQRHRHISCVPPFRATCTFRNCIPCSFGALAV